MWALVLPCALVVGTFGVLAVPESATALAALAAGATPVLGGLAVLHVVPWLSPRLAGGAADHGRRGAAAPLLAGGSRREPADRPRLPGAGALLVRLTPLPWLVLGIAVMCVVDVVLIVTGPGQPAANQLQLAFAEGPIPGLHHAQIGSFTSDYPDLVLAAVLGAVLAGDARQFRAGFLVAALVSASGLLFMVADILPGTVPLAVAAAVVAVVSSTDPARRTGAAPPEPPCRRRARCRRESGRRGLDAILEAHEARSAREVRAADAVVADRHAAARRRPPRPPR